MQPSRFSRRLILALRRWLLSRGDLRTSRPPPALRNSLEQGENGVFELVCKLQEPQKGAEMQRKPGQEELHVGKTLLLTKQMFDEELMDVAVKLLAHEERAKERRRQQETQAPSS